MISKTFNVDSTCLVNKTKITNTHKTHVAPLKNKCKLHRKQKCSAQMYTRLNKAHQHTRKHRNIQKPFSKRHPSDPSHTYNHTVCPPRSVSYLQTFDSRRRKCPPCFVHCSTLHVCVSHAYQPSIGPCLMYLLRISNCP